MGDTAGILNEAYQLIENGQTAEARALITPLLTSDSSNPDVWWLYIHATDDAAEGRRALDRLAELSPSYPGLPELYEQVTGTPLRSAAKPLKPLSKPPAPATLPDLPGSTKPVPVTAPVDPVDDEFDEEFDDEIVPDKPSRRPPWLIFAIGAIVLVVVIGLALLLSQPTTPVVTETPTDVALVPATQEVIPTQDAVNTQAVAATEAIVPTEEASPAETEEVPLITEEAPTEEAPAATDEVVETEIPAATAQIMSATEELVPTDEAVVLATAEIVPDATAEVAVSTAEATAAVASQAVLTEALAGFNLSETDSITTVETSLGNTLVVNACGVPGPAASRVLTDVMEVLAEQVASFPEDVEAAGVNLSDCGTGTPGRTIAVPVETIEAYSRREIDLREFQRLWQPVS